MANRFEKRANPGRGDKVGERSACPSEANCLSWASIHDCDTDLPEAHAIGTRGPSRSFSRQTLLSVVIPCYNEEEVLPLMYKRLSAAAPTGRWTMRSFL